MGHFQDDFGKKQKKKRTNGGKGEPLARYSMAQQAMVWGYRHHFLFCLPLISDGYNFFVRTPFQVFLDSKESPLSQESIHILVEGNWCPQLC